MVLCPKGYCCDGPAWPCDSLGSCAGYRAGPLCGDCLPGYVTALGSTQCRAVDQCSTDTGVVWPLVVGGVLAAALLQLTLVSGVWLVGNGTPTSKFKVAIYFAQMSSLVGTGPGHTSPAADVLLSLLRTQAPAHVHSQGFCAFRSLTPTSKVGLEVALQVSVGLAMVLVWALARVVQCLGRLPALVRAGALLPALGSPFRQLSTGQVEMLEPVGGGGPIGEGAEEGHHQYVALGAVEDGVQGSPVLRPHSGRQGAFSGAGSIQYETPSSKRTDAQRTPSSSRWVERGGGAGAGAGRGISALPRSPSKHSTVAEAAQAGVRSPRARAVAACLNLALTLYAPLTIAAARMLHCVWVPGSPVDQTRLYIHGATVCSHAGWQSPYVVAVAVLVGVPLVLPLVAGWSLPTAAASSRARTPLANDVHAGVRRALVEAYHDHAYFWEAVLMAERLVLVMVSTFVSTQPGVQSLLLSLLTLTFALLHLAAAPLRNRQSHLLQACLCLCLAVVALGGAPFADALARSADTPGTAASRPVALGPGAQAWDAADTFARALFTACGTVVPLVALGLAYVGPWAGRVVRTWLVPCWPKRIVAGGRV